VLKKCNTCYYVCYSDPIMLSG